MRFAEPKQFPKSSCVTIICPDLRVSGYLPPRALRPAIPRGNMRSTVRNSARNVLAIAIAFTATAQNGKFPPVIGA